MDIAKGWRFFAEYSDHQLIDEAMKWPAVSGGYAIAILQERQYQDKSFLKGSLRCMCEELHEIQEVKDRVYKRRKALARINRHINWINARKVRSAR